MPKLKPDTQRARREHILEAAQACFSRAGFHATSMHDICREAGVSPGAVYVYFPSKEALIAGIAERDRQQFQARFAGLGETKDFIAALRVLGERYFVEDPPDHHLICLEVGLEATRNAQVGEIHRSVDQFVEGSFTELFRKLQREGRIAPDLDVATIAQIMMVLGDGMFLRRAVCPGFDAPRAVEGVVEIMRLLLKPVETSLAADPETVPKTTATAPKGARKAQEAAE